MAEIFSLALHGVGKAPQTIRADEKPYWLTESVFLSLLDELEDRPDVWLTFDDGLESDVIIALPAMAARGLSGRFFVTSGRIGSPGFLSANALRELHSAGMRIGSHGVHHRPWRGLPDQDLRRDIADSKKTLEDLLGEPCTEAACPHGQYDQRVLRALREAGYERVFTNDRGWTSDSAWQVPRNTIKASYTGPLERLMRTTRSPWFRGIRGLRTTMKTWR